MEYSVRTIIVSGSSFSEERIRIVGEKLEPLPWDPYFMRELLLADPDGFVPTGFAGIAVCLGHAYGKAGSIDWTPMHRRYLEHMGRRL